MDSRRSFWQMWVGLLPPLYFLSPLSLFALRYLRELPAPVRGLLILYTFTQLLPAFLSPEPLLAGSLALLRSALIASLICLGAHLRETNTNNPFPLLAIGLNIVYLTALLFNFVEHRDFLASRLNHPYITTTTLGLLGAIGIWWSVFHSSRWPLRMITAFLATATLLLSGSRGPLLAVLFGLILGLIIQRGKRRTLLWLIVALLPVLAVAGYGAKNGFTSVLRLMQGDLAGRQIIWFNVKSIIHSEPISGVGTYRLGTRLASPQTCQAFADATHAHDCPTWFDQIGQPWLIAHNAVLQQWAETGPLGTFGLFLLLGGVLIATWRQRQPFAVAVISGLLLTNLNDNTLIVPGAFTGELFWIIAGTQLHVFSRQFGAAAGLMGALLLGFMAVPIALTERSASSTFPPELKVIYTPPNLSSSDSTYSFFANLRLPPGEYLINLNTCIESCRTIQSQVLTSDGVNSQNIAWSQLHLLPKNQQQLQLLVFPNTGLRLGPIATWNWNVTP